MSIDFDTGVITNVTKGETYQAEPFPPFIKDMIQKGGLMASLRKKEGGSWKSTLPSSGVTASARRS